MSKNEENGACKVADVISSVSQNQVRPDLADECGLKLFCRHLPRAIIFPR
jgi:hypothetical protein